MTVAESDGYMVWSYGAVNMHIPSFLVSQIATEATTTEEELR
jgi:hypothetical protein